MARKVTTTAPRPRASAAPRTAAAGASRRIPPVQDDAAQNFFLGLALFLLAIVVYYQAFHAGFIWDDDQLLTANQQVQSPDGWWNLWVHPQTADYFPLTSTTLWFEWRLWGMNSIGYHITNVLFHATAVVLTWQVLKRLHIPGAWIAAALFAAHPVSVESVAWISERKNTISQIFFLLSIIHYVRFEEKGRVWRYGVAVFCFLLALTAKTSVVMLPFLLLMLAWWRRPELEPLRETYDLGSNLVEKRILLWTCVVSLAVAGGLAMLLNPPLGLGVNVGLVATGGKFYLALGSLLAGIIGGAGLGYGVYLLVEKSDVWNSFGAFSAIRSLPFFLVAFLLGVVTIYFQYGRAIGGEEIPIGNLWQRAASASFASGFYLYSALWPFNVIEIYPEWHRAFSIWVSMPTGHLHPPSPDSIPYWLQAAPGLVIAGVLIYCWTQRAQSWARAILIGLGTYFVAMLPALGFLKMSYMRLTLVADHFQYISLISVIALVVAAGYTRKFNPGWLIVAAVCFAEAAYWNWAKTDDNHIYEVAWVIAPLVLAFVPSVAETWRWAWGGVLWIALLCFSIVSFAQVGTYESEGTLWSATLAKNPNTWQGHNHLGAWDYTHGDYKGAFPHFAKAVELKPENPESHNNLGLCYSYFGMMPQAIEQYQIATMIKDDTSMDTNLGNAYTAMKRYAEAIATYKHAIELQPSNASAYCNLGYALLQAGRIPEAIDNFIKTIEISPDMPQGRADLNEALRMEGIDYQAPALSGSYPFDAATAVQLLKQFPPPVPGQQQQ